jgi:hypothetical protein
VWFFRNCQASRTCPQVPCLLQHSVIHNSSSLLRSILPGPPKESVESRHSMHDPVTRRLFAVRNFLLPRPICKLGYHRFWLYTSVYTISWQLHVVSGWRLFHTQSEEAPCCGDSKIRLSDMTWLQDVTEGNGDYIIIVCAAVSEKPDAFLFRVEFQTQKCKIEVAGFSETLVPIYQSVRCLF